MVSTKKGPLQKKRPLMSGGPTEGVGKRDLQIPALCRAFDTGTALRWLRSRLALTNQSLVAAPDWPRISSLRGRRLIRGANGVLHLPALQCALRHEVILDRLACLFAAKRLSSRIRGHLNRTHISGFSARHCRSFIAVWGNEDQGGFIGAGLCAGAVRGRRPSGRPRCGRLS